MAKTILKTRVETINVANVAQPLSSIRLSSTDLVIQVRSTESASLFFGDENSQDFEIEIGSVISLSDFFKGGVERPIDFNKQYVRSTGTISFTILYTEI